MENTSNTNFKLMSLIKSAGNTSNDTNKRKSFREKAFNIIDSGNLEIKWSNFENNKTNPLIVALQCNELDIANELLIFYEDNEFIFDSKYKPAAFFVTIDKCSESKEQLEKYSTIFQSLFDKCQEEFQNIEFQESIFAKYIKKNYRDNSSLSAKIKAIVNKENTQTIIYSQGTEVAPDNYWDEELEEENMNTPRTEDATDNYWGEELELELEELELEEENMNKQRTKSWLIKKERNDSSNPRNSSL